MECQTQSSRRSMDVHVENVGNSTKDSSVELGRTKWSAGLGCYGNSNNWQRQDKAFELTAVAEVADSSVESASSDDERPEPRNVTDHLGSRRVHFDQKTNSCYCYKLAEKGSSRSLFVLDS